MLDKKYTDILKDLKMLKSSAENLLKDKIVDSFENEKSYETLGYLKKEMEDAISDMELMDKNTIEGILVLNSQGRFNLDTAKNIYFTCGSPIEVFINEEWYRGRVENESGEYYFYSYENENIPLREGMKARIRVDRG
jgi:hypothetical protein